MIDYYHILILLFIWAIGWIGYFYSGKGKLKIARDADLSIVYFLFLAFISYLSVKSILPAFIINELPNYFFTVLVIFIAVNHIYFLIRKKFKEPLVHIENHPTDEWLRANRQSIFITSSHILFQQIIITGLVFSIYNTFPDLNHVMKYFAIMFSIMHLPLIFFKGFEFAVMYTLPAFFASIIFSYLLLNFIPYGFILNYIIHWSFYALITYLFWRNGNKNQIQI